MKTPNILPINGRKIIHQVKSNLPIKPQPVIDKLKIPPLFGKISDKAMIKYKSGVKFALLNGSISFALPLHFDIDNIQVSLFWLDNLHHMPIRTLAGLISKPVKILTVLTLVLLFTKTSRHSDRCEKNTYITCIRFTSWARETEGPGLSKHVSRGDLFEHLKFPQTLLLWKWTSILFSTLFLNRLKTYAQGKYVQMLKYKRESSLRENSMEGGFPLGFWRGYYGGLCIENTLFCVLQTTISFCG